MEIIKSFIKYLCDPDLSQDPRKISSDMYNELDTLDVDLEEKDVMKNENLPHSVEIKITDLDNIEELVYIYINKRLYKTSSAVKFKDVVCNR